MTAASSATSNRTGPGCGSQVPAPNSHPTEISFSTPFLFSTLDFFVTPISFAPHSDFPFYFVAPRLVLTIFLAIIDHLPGPELCVLLCACLALFGAHGCVCIQDGSGLCSAPLSLSLAP